MNEADVKRLLVDMLKLLVELTQEFESHKKHSEDPKIAGLIDKHDTLHARSQRLLASAHGLPTTEHPDAKR
jgi:hypothetical protein